MRAAAALSALAAALLLAAPAGAATRQQIQAAAFAVPKAPAFPRDVVIKHPNRAQTRAAASASVARYGVNDGAGRSVDIQVSPGCQVDPIICNAAEPQTIANFLGTLAHGDEMNSLRVDVVHPGPPPAGPGEIDVECGPGADACYFPTQNRIVVSGSNQPAGDGAPRDFVLAHEYGHHLANHRINPPFDSPAIDWGPKRWASYHRVCEGVAAKVYYPGNQGTRYFENPGEAFAESFAFTHFPGPVPPWHWIESLRPDANTFAAIRRDALDPWNGATAENRRGRFGKIRKKRRGNRRQESRSTHRHLERKKQKRKKRRRTKPKRFGTPLDGNLKLTLNGTRRAELDLKLRDSSNRLLARSEGIGSKEAVSYTLCGEQGVTAWVRRHGRSRARFWVNAQIP